MGIIDFFSFNTNISNNYVFGKNTIPNHNLKKAFLTHPKMTDEKLNRFIHKYQSLGAFRLKCQYRTYVTTVKINFVNSKIQ